MDNMDNNEQSTKESLFYFFAKYFKWFLVFFTFLILIIGFLLFIMPKYSHVKAMEKDLEKQKVEYDTGIQREYLSKLNNFISEYKEIKPSLKERINDILSQDFIKEEVFSHIESLVEDNGLILSSINILSENKNKNEKEDKGPVESIKLEVKISGINYSGLKRLIKSFEKSLLILDVESINFDSDNNAATIKLVTYYLK